MGTRPELNIKITPKYVWTFVSQQGPEQATLIRNTLIKVGGIIFDETPNVDRKGQPREGSRTTTTTRRPGRARARPARASTCSWRRPVSRGPTARRRS